MPTCSRRALMRRCTSVHAPVLDDDSHGLALSLLAVTRKRGPDPGPAPASTCKEYRVFDMGSST